MKATLTKHFYVRIAVIVAAILVIIVSSVVLSDQILKLQEQHCTQTLNDSINTLTEEMHNSLYGHRIYLQSIAGIIADYGTLDDDAIVGILANYRSDAIVNRLDILLPDNTILTANGDRVPADPDSALTFDKLVTLEYGVTGKIDCYINGIRDGHAHYIACIHTPIYRDGEVLGILLGVIELEKLSMLVDTEIYGGNANIYVIDGSTGDILVDTGHSGVDNIWDWSGNPLSDDYSQDQLTQELIKGISGQVKFEVQDSGISQYFCYAPIENTSWRVGIAVEETAVFASAQQFRGYIVGFFLVVVLCLSVVMAMILLHTNAIHKKTKIISETDLLTECYNRNKYELDMADLVHRPGDYLGCVYVDVNGLRERNNQSGHDQGDLMLRLIAEHIRNTFGKQHTYRIGGDEFVVMLHKRPENIRELLADLEKRIEQLGYSVAIGFAEQSSTRDAAALTRLAEQIMYKEKTKYYESKNK